MLEAASFYSKTNRAPTEVVIVDDGSKDGTLERLKDLFPGVILVGRPTNEGFACACNSGFRRCRYPLVALLNNDVSVEEDYFVFLAQHFADDQVFAVTARVFENNPPLFATGGKYGRFRRGFWGAYFNYDVEDQESPWISEHRLLSFYAVGGFATYDREKLLELGGFDELLSPFHWEDIDLSYRGWKRGWEIRFEPRSVAYHEISATIKAHYEGPEVEVVARRNRILCHWINLHSKSYLAWNLVTIMGLILTRVWVLDFGFYRSLAAAVARLPAAIQSRKREKRLSRRSDRELSRLLSDFYRTAPLQIYRSRREVEALHVQSPVGKTGRVRSDSPLPDPGEED